MNLWYLRCENSIRCNNGTCGLKTELMHAHLAAPEHNEENLFGGALRCASGLRPTAAPGVNDAADGRLPPGQGQCCDSIWTARS